MKDITENKHKGNVHSVAAHKKAVLGFKKYYGEIVSYLYTNTGATSKEMAKTFETELNKISGRFTELKVANIIQDSGTRSDGCGILVITPKAKKWLDAKVADVGMENALVELFSGSGV